jgi:hypothetical protein
MRISTVISYPLGQLIRANYRSARKSDPVLKFLRGLVEGYARALLQLWERYVEFFVDGLFLM